MNEPSARVLIPLPTKKTDTMVGLFFGAGEGIRTLDINLGNQKYSITHCNLNKIRLKRSFFIEKFLFLISILCHFNLRNFLYSQVFNVLEIHFSFFCGCIFFKRYFQKLNPDLLTTNLSY